MWTVTKAAEGSPGHCVSAGNLACSGRKAGGRRLEVIIYADSQMELGSSPTLFPKAGETLTHGTVNFKQP